MAAAAAAAVAAPQLARPAGAPLPPQLWYFIHSCSLPYVIYYLIFDLACFFIHSSTFYYIYHWWWVLAGGGGKWWW